MRQTASKNFRYILHVSSPNPRPPNQIHQQSIAALRHAEVIRKAPSMPALKTHSPGHLALMFAWTRPMIKWLTCRCRFGGDKAEVNGVTGLYLAHYLSLVSILASRVSFLDSLVRCSRVAVAGSCIRPAERTVNRQNLSSTFLRASQAPTKPCIPPSSRQS